MTKSKSSTPVQLTSYRFSDEVCMRIVQILQEALVLGIDVSDILRSTIVDLPTDGSDKLKLNQQHIDAVNRGYRELEARANEIQSRNELGAAADELLAAAASSNGVD